MAWDFSKIGLPSSKSSYTKHQITLEERKAKRKRQKKARKITQKRRK